MNRPTFAPLAASAALLLLCGIAQAQSSVSIYGRVNTSVESQRTGDAGRSTQMVNNASRIGFKGREDLGGGMYSAFTLESGFDSTTGDANGGFDRESSVELGSAGWGAVRLGNWTAGSYTATADFISMHNHDTGTSSDALYSFASYTPARRVAYLTPVVGGFNAELSRTVDGGDGPETTDLSAYWTQGPWMLGAGYSKLGDTNQWAVRAMYDAGALVLGSYYQREKVDGSINGETRNVYRVAAMYGIGASELHANVGYTDRGGSFATKATQYTLAYNYNLSKRTKVYAFYTAIERPGKTEDFNSLALGVRHNF